MADKNKGRVGRGRSGAKSGPPEKPGKNQQAAALTLSEVAVRTGISMPTLQRYKKLYQNRIPSTGEGRTQRYPVESLAVFEELKRENIGRRGRPRKDASAPASAAPARRGLKPGPKPGRARGAESAGTDGFLTLTAIAERTGISYPTLVRYSKIHGGMLPSRGSGRARRYAPEAIEVFRRLRGESPRGRRPKNAPAAPRAASRGTGGAAPSRADANVLSRLAAIERAQAGLEKQLQRLVELVSRPVRISIDRR